MNLSNSFRRVAACIALFSMLFIQFAVTSYACPAMEMGQPVAMSSAAATQNMCAGMDTEQPVLCHAHGHAESSSLDKSQVPPIQPFIALGQVTTLMPVDVAYRPAAALPAAFLAHATAPPLSIRHCCFRI